MDFHKTWNKLRKWQGGCGSVVCIGLECLCNVLDFKGKVVCSCCVGFVNFRGRRVKQVGIGYEMVKEWPRGADEPIGNKK
jgi:hypothetical protein